jgi:hypothetical protein
MLLAMLIDGSLFVGRGFAESASNRDFIHNLSRQTNPPLRPHPNRSDKY